MQKLRNQGEIILTGLLAAVITTEQLGPERPSTT